MSHHAGYRAADRDAYVAALIRRDQARELRLEGIGSHASPFDAADEDYDPRPLPVGCHQCYLTAPSGNGARCLSCPAVPRRSRGTGVGRGHRTDLLAG